MPQLNKEYKQLHVKRLRVDGAAVAANGYGNYNDTATAITPISALAGVAKKLTCDNLGTQTRETRLYPKHTISYWNTSSNRVDLTEFTLDMFFELRVDIIVTPASPNTTILVHYDFYDSGSVFVFRSTKSLAEIKSASAQSQILDSTFFIGPAIVGGSLEVLVEANNNTGIEVGGFTIFVHSAITA